MLNDHKFVLKPLGFGEHKQNYKYIVSHSGCKTLKHLNLGTAYGESGRTVWWWKGMFVWLGTMIKRGTPHQTKIGHVLCAM